MDQILTDIKQRIEEHPVVLFMKGSPEFPQCGFSMRVVQALHACNATFSYIDVLAEPEIRSNLPRYSSWPTFPQLFIQGQLVGGCDIAMELYRGGKLKELLAALPEPASQVDLQADSQADSQAASKTD